VCACGQFLGDKMHTRAETFRLNRGTRKEKKVIMSQNNFAE
jgi:hypothetical protein